MFIFQNKKLKCFSLFKASFKAITGAFLKRDLKFAHDKRNCSCISLNAVICVHCV